jgi:crotonobetainyl-CoA:carnitine CoA-transferase CaiB-like acyl-CoA transferase
MAELSDVLTGITVLDFGMNIAGPQAASLLADLGADVVKIEGPGGDTSRAMAPQQDGISAMFASMNRNKRYLELDLRRPDARPVLARLLGRADVVVQNLRPGKAATLGISAEQCHAVNPRIVHVSVEAFYPVEQSRPGYDLLVQAETGMMSLTGEPDRPPSRLPGSLLDHISGLWAAFGVVAALRGDRDRTSLTLTMADIALSLLGDRVTSYLMSGEIPSRMGSAIGVTTPLQAYPTADGDIVIGAASDGLFRRLAAVVVPDLVDDPAYSTQAGRLARREELNDRLVESFAHDTAKGWLARLDEAGVPAARIRDLADATERHRTMSRTGLVPVDGLPGLDLVANPLIASPAGPVSRPRPIGDDNRAVLTELGGLSEEEYGRLVADGVVGQTGD